MVNYNNGKIYKIEVDGEVYVGSTTQKLCMRMCGHRKDCKRDINMLLYKRVRERENGWNGINIVLIENYSCKSKEALFAHERYWIETLKASLNERIPTRTPQEYREDNRDAINEKMRDYYEANRDAISEKKHEYYEANKDAIRERHREYREANKDAILEKACKYREANRDAINEKMRDYYEANRDTISEKGREAKWTCPHCNREMRRDSKYHHIKRLHSEAQPITQLNF